MEPMSFHVDDDFIIRYGKEKKEISIPRLLFKNADKVVSFVAKIIKGDIGGIIEMLSFEMNAKQMDGDAIKKKQPMVEKFVEKLITIKSYDIIKEGLQLISEGKITPDIVDEMQYTEAAGILAYLIEQNFDSKKNMTLSLNQIFLSDQSDRTT